MYALAAAAASGVVAVHFGSCSRGSIIRAEGKSSDVKRFPNSVILITGGGGDFGRAGALRFKEAGAHVVLLDASEAGLRSTEQVLKTVAGPESLAIVCDVTKDEAVEAAVHAVEKKFGRITHLWNNAGYQGAVTPTLDYNVADFQRVQDINVVGAFRVLQCVARSMQRTGGGVIVNTASVAALRGTPAMPAYVASKAAILALTMSVAKDLAPHGIRVNAVSPALIGPGFMWDRQNQLHAESGSPYFASDAEAVAKSKIASVPMKRVGSIDEVLKAVAFLLSEESSYCCGTNIIVDGGLAMR